MSLGYLSIRESRLLCDAIRRILLAYLRRIDWYIIEHDKLIISINFLFLQSLSNYMRCMVGVFCSHHGNMPFFTISQYKPPNSPVIFLEIISKKSSKHHKLKTHDRSLCHSIRLNTTGLVPSSSVFSFLFLFPLELKSPAYHSCITKIL